MPDPRKRCHTLSATAVLLLAFAIPAHAQSIEEWCQAHNRDQAAVARCVQAETGQSAPTPPVQRQAPPPDPYADVERQEFLRRYQRAKDRVRVGLHNLGYAEGCDVIYHSEAMVGMGEIFSEFATLAATHNESVNLEDLKRVMQEGVDQAHSEGCDYFKNHPEDVIEMRRRVGRR